MRVLVLALCSLLPCLGCGGSSSETPPPLEPDPTSIRYTGPRFPSADDALAPTPPAEPDEDDLPARSRKPATATWGSGKVTPNVARPAAAPTMTSPTAAPPASAPVAPATPAPAN
jgi:hypothetical protein